MEYNEPLAINRLSRSSKTGNAVTVNVVEAVIGKLISVCDD